MSPVLRPVVQKANEWVGKLNGELDDDGFPIYSTWESSDAYDDYYPVNGDTTFKGIIFEVGNDDGLYNPDNEKSDLESINSDKQYLFDHEERKIIINIKCFVIFCRLSFLVLCKNS